MRSKRVVFCVSLLLCACSPRTFRVEGPDFEVWDFRYGRIETADMEWVLKAQAEGRLDNRELSCRVVKKQARLRSRSPRGHDAMPQPVHSKAVLDEPELTPPPPPQPSLSKGSWLPDR